MSEPIRRTAATLSEWRDIGMHVTKDDILRNLEMCEEELEAAIEGQPTGTEARVCKDIAERQSKSIAKYGQTVEANPLHLREWLQHAYEECLDQAVYLRRAMEEMDKPTAEDWQGLIARVQALQDKRGSK